MKLILSILFSSIMAISFAQESKSAPVHSVGLHAGSTTGLGFSYRYWPGKFGVQITGIPIFSDGESFGSVGVTPIIKLKEFNSMDIFGYLGNHILYSNSDVFAQDPITGITSTEKDLDIIYNIGVGVGCRFRFTEFINLNVQGGYGFYDVTGSVSTNIAIEAGFYYSF